MTSANISTDARNRPTACMFPSCERPARDRAGEGGGKPPIYCDLVNPATGKLAHTPLTAARERARQQRQGATGHPGALNGETPASAARDRAVSLLEQFRTAAEQMSATLDAAIEAMSAAGDPESVSAELTAARRQVERTRLEADERVHTAEAASERAAADTAAAHQAAAEAITARNEAISELDTLDATLATTRAELAQTRAEHTAEQERLRAETEGQLAAARQATADATHHAETTREELRQARTEHREELTALRREHREELTTERQRTDTALDTLRAEHRRETHTLQTALTATRTTTQHETPSPGSVREI